MKDFTLISYQRLIEIVKRKYQVVSIGDLSVPDRSSSLSFRHDVDRKPHKALDMATIEYHNQIQSTYFFRISPKCAKPDIVKQVSDFGHDIGYHYENLATVARKLKINKADLSAINRMFSSALMNRMDKMGIWSDTDFTQIIDDTDKRMREIIIRMFEYAIIDFEQSLQSIRKIVPVDTIAMHGCPGVPIDNRILWVKYDYKTYGVKIEPYFDIDYSQVLYFTDAGRSWNDSKANKRDKVETTFDCTASNINAITETLMSNSFSNRVLVNIHPEHWTDSFVEWHFIWLSRKVKNFVKRMVLN